ncbi:hypothetical protein K438DRAFT_1853150 [Mycena galopus ATCC 62051]|nr:hypothetical protein K438DRAFT_1853150 [Mycena galopus ATCC 62051]
MESVDTSPPILPPELERAIFEIAAISSPASISKFMRVAWRVKSWVEPLLYRTFIVDDWNAPPRIKPSTLVSLIQSKPASFFRDSVRHLYLARGSAADEAIILSACSALENLWLWAQTSLQDVSQRILPLKRFHGTLHAMFRSSPIDFTHQLFSSITHLEIFDVPDNIDLDVWSALTRLAHLTHLSFDDRGYLQLCHTLLPTWQSLQVMIILVDTRMGVGVDILDGSGVTELAQEPRFIVMCCNEFLEDWIKSAHAARDYWVRAEEFIAKRKSGEIDALKYYISDSEDDEDSVEDNDDEDSVEDSDREDAVEESDDEDAVDTDSEHD